jgi:hypothetical protein
MIEELHCMIDLETLSTRANAVIVEVGYSLFETQGSGVNQSGRWNLRLEEQIDSVHMLRDVSTSTLMWWLDQSKEAQESAFKGLPKYTIQEFLAEFQEVIPWHNIQAVWCKGLTFDLPMLEDLHKQYGKLVPWHYRTPRDMRTLTWLAGMSSADHVKPTLAHSAESDCIAQAQTVQMALKKLEGMQEALHPFKTYGENA